METIVCLKYFVNDWWVARPRQWHTNVDDVPERVTYRRRWRKRYASMVCQRGRRTKVSSVGDIAGNTRVVC